MLLVDDDDHARHAIVRVLAEYAVDAVATSQAAKTLLRDRRYHAWIFDMSLGLDTTGLDLLAWARAEDLATPALLITGQDHVDRALSNQALFWDAFFAHKPVSGEHLKRFVTRALATSESVPSVGRRYSRLRGLSPRETELVAAIASGVSRGDVAEYLHIEEETVKSMVKRIRLKTGVENLGALLRELLATVSGLDSEALGAPATGESDPRLRSGTQMRAPLAQATRMVGRR